MPRKPLSEVDPRSGYALHSEHVPPEYAALIGWIVVGWAEVDTQMSILLSALLGVGSDAAVAVFLSLQNARAQTEAIKAAASAALREPEEKDYLALFHALMDLREK